MLYENVTSKRFPIQCEARLNRRVYVVFHDNLMEKLGGQLVRCDEEMPFVTIIKLDDGRHVLDSECLFDYEDTYSPTVGEN
jgi:hypothetical protein